MIVMVLVLMLVLVLVMTLGTGILCWGTLTMSKILKSITYGTFGRTSLRYSACIVLEWLVLIEALRWICCATPLAHLYSLVAISERWVLVIMYPKPVTLWTLYNSFNIFMIFTAVDSLSLTILSRNQIAVMMGLWRRNLLSRGVLFV